MRRLLGIALLCLWAADVRAQTDPRGHWRTWHTLHFRIHARAEHAPLALLAGREAERAWAALSRELVPPRGTVDLVLYDNVDFANGSTVVFPRNQVNVYLTPPAGESGLARYDDWFRLVITHELTHVFHLDRSAGIWRVLQAGFGRAPGLFPNAYRPSWVTEGLAVYYESRLTDGGRLRGGFHRQVLNAAANAGRFPAPEDATFASAKWPAGLGPYVYGSHFFEWETRTFGSQVVPRFIESTSRRLWPLDLSAPLAKGGGARLHPGWTAFRESWGRDSSNADSTGVLIRGLRVEPRPRVSPDGRWIAYVDADGKRTSDVVVRDTRTWAEVGRHEVTAEVELTWVGADLVVAQLEFHSPVEIRSDLYRWRPGSTWRKAARETRLTRPFALSDTSVGAVRMTPGGTTLVRVGADTVALLAAPDADAWSRLAMSPDGRWLAGGRHADGRWDIVMWPAGSPGEARRITDDAALDEDPVWTPDGGMVVFASERGGLPQIYGFRVATGELMQFTRDKGGAREPSLGLDGTLFYATVLNDGYAVVSRAAAPGAADAAVAGVVPFTEAPEVAMRESGYRPWPALLPAWWWPVAHDGGTAGTFVGGVTSAGDQVGRSAYRVALAHALENDRWEWGLATAYTRWANVTLDASASQAWGSGGVVQLGPRTFPVYSRDNVGGFGISVRRRRWRTDASLRLGAEFRQEALSVDDSIASQVHAYNPTLGGGIVSLRLGRFNSRALAISTENGVVLTGFYRHRWEMDSTRWAHEVHAALRGYLALPLPGFARWVLALRVAGAASGGTRPPQRFGMGGESSDIYTVVPGVSIGGGGREFPLRGYDRFSAGYNRAVVGAAELRIPLFLIARGIPRLPLALDKVSASLFGEAGGGWGAGPVNLARYRDIGAELVSDWGINFDTPLRVRAGVARALTSRVNGTPGGTRWYLALGSAF